MFYVTKVYGGLVYKVRASLIKLTDEHAWTTDNQEFDEDDPLNDSINVVYSPSRPLVIAPILEKQQCQIAKDVGWIWSGKFRLDIEMPKKFFRAGETVPIKFIMDNSNVGNPCSITIRHKTTVRILSVLK